MEESDTRWRIFPETQVDALRGIDVPSDIFDDWHRMCDGLEEDLGALEVEGEDSALPVLGKKRPDAVALNHARRQVLILEFTRAYDLAADWQERTDERKRERYTPLRNRLAQLLPKTWQVEIMALTVGVRGSYQETVWQFHLTQLGITGNRAKELMRDLAHTTLMEADGMCATRQVALRNRGS